MWLCRIDDCVDDEYLRDDEEKQKGSWLEDIEDDEEILTDVVACPDVIFPPLKHSCYVSRESVFGPPPDENNNPLQTKQDGPVLTKKLTPPKK